MDTAGRVAALSTVAAAVVAVLALVVAALAWREARRSAAAAEEAAKSAARSAAAEEAALALAVRAAEQHEADRHDAAGPQFDVVQANMLWTGGSPVTDFSLRVDGGPDRMNIRVELAPETTYKGLCRARSARVLDALTFDVVPGATIRLWAQPPESADQCRRLPHVPLRVIVEADRDRRWVRRVRVELEPL